MKRLSPKQHGFIDYASVAANLAMVRLAATPAGKRLVTAAAAGIAGLSLFTDYELGLFRTVPMKTHLTVDTVTGPLLLASPLFLKGESPRMKQMLVATGIVGTAATLATRSNG